MKGTGLGGFSVYHDSGANQFQEVRSLYAAVRLSWHMTSPPTRISAPRFSAVWMHFNFHEVCLPLNPEFDVDTLLDFRDKKYLLARAGIGGEMQPRMVFLR